MNKILTNEIYQRQNSYIKLYRSALPIHLVGITRYILGCFQKKEKSEWTKQKSNEMAELLLDPNIRIWVFLPIVVITFFTGIIRHYVTILLTSEKKTELQQVTDR